MSIRTVSYMIAVISMVCGVPAPVYAQSDGFLTAIGGSTDIRTVGIDTPQGEPYRRDAQYIAGQRFFSEKLKSGAMATAETARRVFTQQCAVGGGQIVADSHRAVIEFRHRFLDDLIQPVSYSHQWRGLAAVCIDDPNHVRSAMIAVVYDPTAVVTSGDAGSKLMMGLFIVPTKTAVYLFKPEAVTAPGIIDEQERRKRELLAEYRKTLQIGSATNCGTVIDIRGPLAQIQVNNVVDGTPPTRWVKLELLAPPGGSCLSM